MISKPISAETSRPLKIFVVEDHPDTLTYLKMYLEGYGHTVFSARSKQEALEALSRVGCDVFISDIGLADGSGWELLAKLKEQGHAPPYAIAISGPGMNADQRHSKEAGFRHHLLKPFEPARFEALMREAADELYPAG